MPSQNKVKELVAIKHQMNDWNVFGKIYNMARNQICGEKKDNNLSEMTMKKKYTFVVNNHNLL